LQRPQANVPAAASLRDLSTDRFIEPPDNNCCRVMPVRRRSGDEGRGSDFRCDGTLVDTEELHRQAYNHRATRNRCSYHTS